MLEWERFQEEPRVRRINFPTLSGGAGGRGPKQGRVVAIFNIDRGGGGAKKAPFPD